MDNYLVKGFFIIEKDYKQLSILLNDAKLRDYVVDQLETDFCMSKNIAIYSVENTVNKFHTQSDFHLIYK